MRKAGYSRDVKLAAGNVSPRRAHIEQKVIWAFLLYSRQHLRQQAVGGLGYLAPLMDQMGDIPGLLDSFLVGITAIDSS